MITEEIRNEMIQEYRFETYGSLPHIGVYQDEHPQDSMKVIKEGFSLFKEWLRQENQKLISVIQDYLLNQNNSLVQSRLKRSIEEINIHGYYIFEIEGSYYFTNVPNPAIRKPMTKAVEDILVALESAPFDPDFVAHFRGRVEEGKKFLASCQLDHYTDDTMLSLYKVLDICKFDDHKPFKGLFLKNVKQWVENGELPAVKENETWKVRKMDLSDFFCSYGK